jgi:predicted Ser/Thr protein kinase
VQGSKNLEKMLLKKDLFGEVWQIVENGDAAILRDTRPARWWLAWIARGLMRREARILAALDGIDGVPQLLQCQGAVLRRTFIRGVPLYEGRPDDREYFKTAAQLLCRLHRAGVAHNDLAKEPNILLRDDGSPAFIDFQLATWSRRRGRLFRAAAREDIRHLLKHKRTYRADLLTQRERNILDTPSSISRIWMAVFKPLYVFVTRKLFRWSDREGAADRGKLD